MYSSVNTIWVLFGAALVFFMQAGFAMVETGFTRAKNAGNIIMKNLMDFCIGTPTFWIVGFGIMFGAGNGFFGKIGGIATEANYGSAMLPDGVPFWAFLIFQTVFCATSATIVSGAMAERTKFSSYCIYSSVDQPVLFIRYPDTGSGAADWSARWASMILQVPVQFIWLVVSAALIGAMDPWTTYRQIYKRRRWQNPKSRTQFRDTTLPLGCTWLYSFSGSGWYRIQRCSTVAWKASY